MKSNSILQLKHVVWGLAGLVVVILLLSVTHLRAKPTTQAAPPVVEVAPVEQRDVPVYGEWIGTLTGQVNADVKAQVTGSFFVSHDDQIARISRMKASIFFVIRARSGPRFCSRQIPLKNVMTRPASESLSSRAPRAAARLSMRS
jgi:hypothetical protein